MMSARVTPSNHVTQYIWLCIPQHGSLHTPLAPPILKPLTSMVPRPMIHLAHVRDRQAAQRWLARRRRHLESNPVPLLIVTVSQDHQTIRRTFQEAHMAADAFIVDASGFGSQFMVPPDTLVLEGPHRLAEATAFIQRAQSARQRLDVLVVDDAVRPDLTWCEPFIDGFEALV